MTRLTVWEDATKREVLKTTDRAEIAQVLAQRNVRYERWDGVTVADGATNDEILTAYRPYLDKLMGTLGSPRSADVISLTPDHPMKDALRAKFLQEHTHSDDEIRFFVRGSGNFVLHLDGKVWDIHCEQGDLLSVPAGTKHWFDAGENPRFTALRIFLDEAGWVAQYTGDDIADRFPVAA